MFDDRRGDLAWAREQLAALLSPSELAAARRNTLNAHYTDAGLVAAVWRAARALGFRRGRVLEPGCGSGNFIAFAPDGAQMTGVELDPVTAATAAALYPDADIRAESFADTKDANGSYDLAIGNVPFGAMVLHDRRHNPGGHSIHNHFIIKTLHLVRPGGLVMILTSRYTMDARNPAARREIADLADLVGAVRLPSGAHQQAAGTGVVTDLLVLRRREPGRQPQRTPWEQTRLIELDGAEVPVNEYFLASPATVLGEMHAVHGAYRDDDLVVRPAGDTLTAFNQALDHLTAWARDHGLTWSPDAVSTATRSQPAVRPRSQEPDGYLSAHEDGTFTKAVSGTERPHDVPATQAAELRHLLALRDTVRSLLDAEGASADDTPQISGLRAELGRLYDSYLQVYGPLNRFSLRRTGRSDPATGEPVLARIRPRQGGFGGPGGDPFAPLVYALEQFDPVGQRAAKSAVFRERVIAPRVPRLGADSPDDALAICLDTCGEVRLGEIARLLGTTEGEARGQIGTLVFDDPGTGRLVPAAEYLSGNVRDKLRAAERAAEDDPRFAVNVAGLRKVVPPDLGPGEIDARLGAAWVDVSYIQQFLRETLDDPDLRVEHPGAQVWAVQGNTGTVLARSTWGTDRYPAPRLAQALLEQRAIQVHDTVKDPDGRDRAVLNVDATLAAQEKAAGLAERFSSWAWENPARAAELARIYNERFNNLVLRNYDNARLSLPGLALTFRPRPHQVAAVARIVHEPSVLLAHEVGAGKTAEMIIGVTELRRLGLVRKPAVVVPNHMLEQFGREWLQLYPQARVLLAGREDLQGEQRRRFVARCATGNWDGIVMSRSAFERIPLSAVEQRAYIEQELAQMRQWIQAAKKDGGGLTVKRLEGALLRAEERLKAKLDSAKDPGITFEATGIDYLAVDEAHGYKNLRTPSNIPDAAIDGAMRASDLDMKVGYLRRRNGNRVVTFATATPIANSVTEAYVMQRYLRPDLLEGAGIEVFDTWAATFGQVVTQIELAPEGGSSFRMKSRFARFANVPEMLRMLHVAADVKTADDLKLPIPEIARREDGKRAAETVIVEPSDELLDYVHDLGERASRVRNRQVGPDEDNMLKISGDGRRAALDLRLLGMAQTTPGKVEAAADRIAAIWAQHRDDQYPDPDGRPYPARGSLQLVFCDLGTPAHEWNVYNELRSQLLRRGLPCEAIRFIHEAKTDRDKGRLFAACRAGSVAVLIGSTEKMGVGTNVQDRAIALHHLDAPWRPADVAQREGRILRQGNLNREVSILRYVTERSFDGYMWQTLERKARFISQVMHGRLDTREIADIGDTALSFSEVKALATGNPLLMDKAEADAALSRLQRAERAHQRNQDALRRAVEHHEAEIARLTRLGADIDAAIRRRRDTHGENFTMTIGGQRYGKRVDAGLRLKQLAEREISALTGSLERTVDAGELGGFPVSVAVIRALGKTQVTINLDGAPGASVDFPATSLHSSDPAGLVTRLENRLARLEEHKASTLADTEHARREITHARDSLGQPFPHAAELAAARDRAQQIDEALERMAAPKQEEPAAQTAEPAEPGTGAQNGATGHGGREPADLRDTVRTEPTAPAAVTSRVAHPPQAQPGDREAVPPRPALAQRTSPGQAVQPIPAVPEQADDPLPQEAQKPGTRREPGHSGEAAQPAPGDDPGTQASQIAIEANKAYRAGDLDRARQLVDQAAELDPSRAGLWQQHRSEIAARQLLLQARQAHAEGGHSRAEKLITDARTFDPRMRTLWDGDLSGIQASVRSPGVQEREPHLGDNLQPHGSGSWAGERARVRWPAADPRWTPRPTADGRDAPEQAVASPGTSRRPPRPDAGQASHATQETRWQPPPIHSGLTPRPASTAEPGLGEGQRSRRIPDRDGGQPPSRPTRQTYQERSNPAPSWPDRRLPSDPAEHAEPADWRDNVIEKGRQQWQPRVVQPDGTAPRTPEAEDLEATTDD